MKLFKYKWKIVHIKFLKNITIKGNFYNTSGKLKKNNNKKKLSKYKWKIIIEMKTLVYIINVHFTI